MTNAQFRRYLNEKFPFNAAEDNSRGAKGSRYGARKRPYGDYLWAADREMFLIEKAEYEKAGR